MYHFVYREQIKTGQRPKLLKAIAFLGLATLAWSVVFILAALIPAAFNPVLPPLVTILIGAAAFGARYLLKRNITFAMPCPQFNNKTKRLEYSSRFCLSIQFSYQIAQELYPLSLVYVIC